MSEPTDTTEPRALPPPPRRFAPSRTMIGATALAGMLIAGAALGAGGMRLAQHWQPRSVMLLQPAPIDQIKDASTVAVKGEVAEVFGNKFVLQDNSGLALVDTGRQGDDRKVAARGEALTVQGRYERGVIHAEMLMHGDGRAEAFGPPHGPKDGPKGPRAPKDARADRGPPPPPADRPEPTEDRPPPR